MKEITSVNNNYIKDLIKLKQKKYRDINKLFIVEGYNIIKEAKDYLNTILISDKKKISEIKDNYKNIDIILVTDEIINKLSSTQTPQGIIGICKYKEVSNIKGNVVMLDGLQDPGNIGTLIRSAMAFGFNDIYFIDCPDIYSEKVVRSSMGGVFKINAHTITREELINRKKEICDILVSTILNGEDLTKICLPKLRVGVIIGNEGNGVSEQLILASDKAVTLPMSGEVESLNAGVAGSILMFEIFKGE